jgi:hypothetical protein
MVPIRSAEDSKCLPAIRHKRKIFRRLVLATGSIGYYNIAYHWHAYWHQWLRDR